MDLSKKAKTRRDAVEDPLRLIDELLEEFSECQVRIDAATNVWPETKRTLGPASNKQKHIVDQMEELKTKLAAIWQQGHKRKWKD